MCTATEDYPKPLNQFIQVSWADFFHCMKGKLESVSEEEMTEAEHEMEILFPQMIENNEINSMLFKSYAQHLKENASSKAYEFRLRVAKYAVRRMTSLKEIYGMHDKNEPFGLVQWNYNQTKRGSGLSVRDEAAQALIEYEDWLEKYGYDQMGEKIDEELAKAQEHYFAICGFYYEPCC